MCVRARFPPISGEAETSLVEGQSNGPRLVVGNQNPREEWKEVVARREEGKRRRGGGKKRKKNRQSRESLALANALITR